MKKKKKKKKKINFGRHWSYQLICQTLLCRRCLYKRDPSLKGFYHQTDKQTKQKIENRENNLQ